MQPFGDLWDTMPHHWSPRASHPTFPRVAENFPSGGKYSEDVSLPTFLVHFQLLPQDCSLKNYVFKIVLSKNTFHHFYKNFLPQKFLFQKIFQKIDPSIKYFKNIFLKISPSRNTFSKLFPGKKHISKLYFKNIAPSKSTFSKVLSQKIHFQSMFLSPKKLLIFQEGKPKKFLLFLFTFFVCWERTCQT